MPLQPADASVGGVRQRPLSTGATLLQRAQAALVHPAQGTGLLQWQVATVLSEVTGARTRRATRPSARVNGSAPWATSAHLRSVLAEKIPRESCAACRDEVCCVQCSGRRRVRRPLRTSPPSAYG